LTIECLGYGKARVPTAGAEVGTRAMPVNAVQSNGSRSVRLARRHYCAGIERATE
jgi:hypothetical protein